MKTVRLKVIDYGGMKPECVWEYNILSQFYRVELVDRNPDYILDGGLGAEHMHYPNAIKIVRVGESYVPDFNQFDYAIGFDHLSFGDRYLRMPLFAYYSQFRDLCSRPPTHPSDSSLVPLAKRDFCSFVVSNPDGDPLRLEFFRRLSKYKPVASGGRLLNNVGGPVPNKMDFLKKYKFNIAFENSCVPGYTTEKVMEPLAARAVPIYYGNPLIAEDFNPACMVRVASCDDVERAVEEIISLDRDDEAYLARLSAPMAIHDYSYYERQLTDFIRSIFDRPLASARRLNDYGYQINIRRRQKRARQIYEWTSPKFILRKILGK